MDLIVSAVAGDLINRFMSFLINRYKTEENLEEKMKRLHDLLIRVHMIVEEAKARYITNPHMLFQLKKLMEVMYRGYHIMDIIKYRTIHSSSKTEVSIFNDLPLTTSISRHSRKRSSSISHDLQSALDNLESAVSNSKEFVLLLWGCERICHGPYDSYLYIDNFMFGRHVEKQQIINILLQDNIPPFSPTVLPVIGGGAVGKKTLIAHVCTNDKVRSHFSSILHLNGENIGAMEHGPFITGKALVVVEFRSDVNNENWLKFYSGLAKQMGRGSKIIIISRVAKISRFGTVKHVHLNSLSHEEYSYLFKVLVFGSTNPEEQPQLASIAKDLAVALGGSLVRANVYAHMLRKNQNVRFWLSIQKRYWNMVENNFKMFGEHPRDLLDKGHPVNITRLASSSDATLLLMPSPSKTNDSKRELPKVKFADLLADTASLPKEFELVSGECWIHSYKWFVSIAEYCEDDKISMDHSESPSKKRQRLDK
ncbi:unnamed protein product [Urochloa decumbens]|uniref:Disease resistance N-terminal domain-containing protein n=1 Tax=Urochloa decumbens TaxID=240449 RepID=A0ABC9B0Z0_9POAL